MLALVLGEEHLQDDRSSSEHGGAVTLETSEPGLTVFSLSLAKSTLHSFEVSANEQRSTMPLTPD